MARKAMTIDNAVILLEQAEQNLHLIYTLAPLSEPLAKQVRDHAAQTQLLANRLADYGKKVSGVVRAKN